MPVERKPQFSPMGLNLLMLLCIVLILMFSATQKDTGQDALPDAPIPPVRIWQTDSQAKVWFSPLLAARSNIQLWYKAGYRYDGTVKGKAFMLSQLLQAQAKQQGLPVAVSFNQDFIKVALTLSSDPIVMAKQLNAVSDLLYRPRLSQTHLATLRKFTPNDQTQALMSQGFKGHDYQGPARGDRDSLSGISRRDIQVFHQAFMHPVRLRASIVGDIDEPGAQIIMESLLPISKQIPAAVESGERLASAWAQQGILKMLRLPGMKAQDDKAQVRQLVSADLWRILLKSVDGQALQWIPGELNNTLLLQGQQNLHSDYDWDKILAAKRQLVGRWMGQLNNSAQLSHYLVKLNAYDLPVDNLVTHVQVLKALDKKQWHTALKQLQAPALMRTALQ